jgi:hypothetical protein
MVADALRRTTEDRDGASMKKRKYKAILTRDVLVTCPGGSGIRQSEMVEVELRVETAMKDYHFEGQRGQYVYPGIWNIAKLEEIKEDPHEDDPPDESGQYKDEELDSCFGRPLQTGRFVFRSTLIPAFIKVWDRKEGAWVFEGPPHKLAKWAEDNTIARKFE